METLRNDFIIHKNLLTNINMFLRVEKGIRARISRYVTLFINMSELTINA